MMMMKCNELHWTGIEIFVGAGGGAAAVQQ